MADIEVDGAKPAKLEAEDYRCARNPSTRAIEVYRVVTDNAAPSVDRDWLRANAEHIAERSELGGRWLVRPGRSVQSDRTAFVEVTANSSSDLRGLVDSFRDVVQVFELFEGGT